MDKEAWEIVSGEWPPGTVLPGDGSAEFAFQDFNRHGSDAAWEEFEVITDTTRRTYAEGIALPRVIEAAHRRFLNPEKLPPRVIVTFDDYRVDSFSIRVDARPHGYDKTFKSHDLCTAALQAIEDLLGVDWLSLRQK